MRPLFLFLLGAASALAQPFSFGLRGGLPMTDFLSAAQSGHFSYASNTNRYIIGPTAELRLPFGLGIEADILYRHFSYTGTGGSGQVFKDPLVTTSTTSNAWEFPLLLKYRLPGKIIHPYVDGGVAWDKLSGLKQAVTSAVAGLTPSTSSTSSPVELGNSTSRGFVLGGGISVKVLVIRVSPEIRYTRWGAKHFLDPNGGLSSNRNQAEFLVGITF